MAEAHLHLSDRTNFVIMFVPFWSNEITVWQASGCTQQVESPVL